MIFGAWQWNNPNAALTPLASAGVHRYPRHMDEEVIAAFVDKWLRDNAGVIDEIVALVGDDPRTPSGAALEAALAAMPGWKPKA